MNRQFVRDRESPAASPKIAVRLPLRNESDVAAAYRAVRELARTHGMPFTAIEELVTGVSEIARNVIDHAGEGELLAGTLRHEGRAALVVITEDRGPGIANVEAALVDGFSTGTGLGLGLASASRFVDAFEIDTELDRGTTVTLTKWIDRPR